MKGNAQFRASSDISVAAHQGDLSTQPNAERFAGWIYIKLNQNLGIVGTIHSLVTQYWLHELRLPA